MRAWMITVVGLGLGAAVVAVGCSSLSESRSDRSAGSESVAEETLPPAENSVSGDATELPRIRPSADGAFPQRVSFRDGSLGLNGTALCEWGFFGVDLYVAALYAERPVDSARRATAGDQVLSIHLDFVRSLTRAQLREAYEASVGANAGDDLAGYRASLDALLSTMRDVRAGDSYTFTAEPGAGLWVQHNRDLVAMIEDDRFARLFVSLYVGDQPPTEAVRDGLLGLRR